MNISKTRAVILVAALDKTFATLQAQRCFGTDSINTTSCVNYSLREDGTEVKCAVGALIPPHMLSRNGGFVGDRASATDLPNEAIAVIYSELHAQAVADFGPLDSAREFNSLAADTQRGFRSFLISSQGLHDSLAHRCEIETERLEWMEMRHQQSLYCFRQLSLMLLSISRTYDLTEEKVEALGERTTSQIARNVGHSSSTKVSPVISAATEFILLR